MGIRPYMSKWKEKKNPKQKQKHKNKTKKPNNKPLEDGLKLKFFEENFCLNINKHISIYSSLVFNSISLNSNIHFQAYSVLVVRVFQNRFLFRIFTFQSDKFK